MLPVEVDIAIPLPVVKLSTPVFVTKIVPVFALNPIPAPAARKATPYSPIVELVKYPVVLLS